MRRFVDIVNQRNERDIVLYGKKLQQVVSADSVAAVGSIRQAVGQEQNAQMITCQGRFLENGRWRQTATAPTGAFLGSRLAGRRCLERTAASSAFVC